MNERMHQILDSLRRQIGEESWDAFFEAMYDAFGGHDELEGENAVLFEQVHDLKRENNELKMKFIAANRKSIDLEHEVADLKAEYEGCIEPLHYRPDTWERIEEDARKAMSLYSMPNVVMTLVVRCKALCERTKDGDAE